MPDGTTTRRSALLQTRSQETRRKLIRAALDLWNARGFDEAFETTTAEEIARAAGVSKGTFYFHFAHKEDVLLEMSWATAEVMAEEADAAMGRATGTGDLVGALMVSLARRMGRAPRAAVLRVMAHLARATRPLDEPMTLRGFGEVFQRVVDYGRDRGELPSAVDAAEVGALLQAATMDALATWAASAQSAGALRDTLTRRAEVILAGAAASYGG